MEPDFHRLVQKDLRAVLRYYEEEGGPVLADRFFAELEMLVSKIVREPHRFHLAPNGLRRANMTNFPYHFLFRENPEVVRIFVLRHHRRHPDFGLGRK